MNIIQHIEKRADFLYLHNEKLSDLKDAEGDLKSEYLEKTSEYVTELGIPHPKPAFVCAGRAVKETLDRRFDELFSAQGNLVMVAYSVNEALFKSKRLYPLGSDNEVLTTNIVFGRNDNYPNADGLTITALTDKYALGFNWYFDNDRANDKRLFFETLKYIHGVWRETAIGAQITDGEGLDRELQFIKTDDGELKFSVILNAYKYCKLIGFTTSFDLFNAALLTKENGLRLFVRREPELFFTDKVEVL